jgi:hypothetical protein
MSLRLVRLEPIGSSLDIDPTGSVLWKMACRRNHVSAAQAYAALPNPASAMAGQRLRQRAPVRGGKLHRRGAAGVAVSHAPPAGRDRGRDDRRRRARNLVDRYL